MMPMLMMMGGMFVIMYFFMIRPQQKKQNDQKNFISGLKKGDQVVTIGGLHGRIRHSGKAKLNSMKENASSIRQTVADYRTRA